MSRSSRFRLTWSHIRWAFRIVREVAPWLYLAAFAMTAIQAVVPAGIALSARGLVNSLSQAASGVPLINTDAYRWLLLGFLATLGGSVAHAVKQYLGRRFVIELRERLQLDIVRHHVSMPLELTESKEYLNSLRRAEKTPETHVANLFGFSLELATKVLQILSLLVILLAIEPLLLAFLVPVGLPFLIFRWRLVRRQFEELNLRVEQERGIAYYHSLLTDPEQAGEIRLFQLGPVFTERYQGLMAGLRRIHAGYLDFEFVGNMIFSVFSVGAIYLALAHTLPVIAAGKLTLGDLAIFGGAAGQMRSLVEQGISQLAALRWQSLSVDKLQHFLNITPASKPAGSASPDTLEGRIELRDVSFRYPGAAHDTLQQLSLTIEPGETVALVGDNGAGKSTVAKLVSGLYEVQEGSLLFDGQDSRTLDPLALQRQIACVFQQFGRYEATAADTLAFGDWPRLGGNLEAIEAVARLAQVDDLIKAMPDGYDTRLGKRFGHYLPSGGQWQKLAFARLIGRDARILILDEPTASLDVVAEAELFEQFRNLAAGRTTLLISHRFSTVSIADRILVIDQGRIVESGSHRELLALNGRYATLFALAYRFPEGHESPEDKVPDDTSELDMTLT